MNFQEKLPDTIFVRWDDPSQCDRALLAEDNAAASVDGDGPTDVGVYTLTRVIRLHKPTVEALVWEPRPATPTSAADLPSKTGRSAGRRPDRSRPGAPGTK